MYDTCVYVIFKYTAYRFLISSDCSLMRSKIIVFI